MSRTCKAFTLVLMLLIGCYNKTTLHDTNGGQSASSRREAVENKHSLDTFSLPAVTKEYYLHAKELLQKYRFDSLNRIDFTKMRFSFVKYYGDKLAKSGKHHPGSLHGFPITSDQIKLVRKLNEEMANNDFAKARATVDKILEINYTDLEMHAIKSQIDFELNKPDTLHFVIVNKLLESIQSFNDGLTAYSPLHLIAAEEIDEMLSVLRFKTLKNENLDGNLFAVTFIGNKNDTVKAFCEVNTYVASRNTASDWRFSSRPGSNIGHPYFVRSPDKIKDMVEKSGMDFIRCDSINDILYKAYFVDRLKDTLKSYFQVVRFPKRLPILSKCKKADSSYYIYTAHDVYDILEASGCKFLQGTPINNCVQKVLYLGNNNDTASAYFKLIHDRNDNGDDCGETTDHYSAEEREATQMNSATHKEVSLIQYRDLEYDIRPAIRAYYEFAKSHMSKNELKILDSILAVKPYNSTSPIESDDLYNMWVDKENDRRYGKLKTDCAKVEYSLLNALCKELQNIEVTYKAGNPEPVLVSPTPFQTYFFNIRQEKERKRKRTVLAALKKASKGSIISLTYSLQSHDLNGGAFELFLNGKIFWKTVIASYSLSGNIPITQAIKPGNNHVQLRIRLPNSAKAPSFSGGAELLLASKEQLVETTGGNSGSFVEFVFDPIMMTLKQDSYYEVETSFEFGIGKP